MESSTTTHNPRFLVALSFPGEKRFFVEQIAEYLSQERCHILNRESKWGQTLNVESVWQINKQKEFCILLSRSDPRSLPDYTTLIDKWNRFST